VLWLPVVVADVLAFSIRKMQSATAHAVVRAFQYHSVLGGSPEPLSPYSDSVWKLGLFTIPIF
jgi:hypothetical protein